MDHLTALKVFRAVAANGGFAAAARQMNLSPAAVSKNVAELEAHLKVRLINRTTRSMSLTEAGEVYWQRLERILDDLEAADAALTSMQQGPSGLLRVSAPLTLALTCLTPAIPAFLQRYPDLRLELLLQDGRQDLIAEGIDLALRGSDRVADSGLVARPLLILEHVLCAAPAYLRQRAPINRPEQLTEVDWISLNTSNHLNHLTLSGPDGEVCKLRLEPRVAANGMLAVRQFTLDGLGVSYQPLPEVRDALNDGRLQQLLPEWRIPGLGIYAVTPRREAQPAKVKVAIEALRRAFATDGDERWS